MKIEVHLNFQQLPLSAVESSMICPDNALEAKQNHYI